MLVYCNGLSFWLTSLCIMGYTLIKHINILAKLIPLFGFAGMKYNPSKPFSWDLPGGPVAKTLSSQGQGPGFSGQGTRPHMLQLIIFMLQLKILHATTKTEHSQKIKTVDLKKKNRVLGPQHFAVPRESIVGRRQKIKKTWKSSLGASFLHSTRESWKEPISSLDKTHTSHIPGWHVISELLKVFLCNQWCEECQGHHQGSLEALSWLLDLPSIHLGRICLCASV